MSNSVPVVLIFAYGRIPNKEAASTTLAGEAPDERN